MTEEIRLRVAEQFEALDSEGRFPIRVSHLRGANAFGCDIVSVATSEIRDRVLRDQVVDSDNIVRFIEVKGSQARGGAVELTPNEREAALRYGARYFIYRVYTDPDRQDYHEVAIMCDPTSSPGETPDTRWSYNFAAGSGAQWFRMPVGIANSPEELPAPRPNGEDADG